MSTFLKNWPVKVLGGRCLSVWGPLPPPPPLHTKYIYPCTYSHREGGGEGGRWTSEKVRGALVHKRGRKYQHDWLYLQSINCVKYQKRRHLGFGVFIDIFFFFIFYTYNILSFNHNHTIHLSVTIRRGLSPSPHRLKAQWEKPSWDAEPRIELGPALQQDDVLPTKPSRTIDIYVWSYRESIKEKYSTYTAGYVVFAFLIFGSGRIM